MYKYLELMSQVPGQGCRCELVMRHTVARLPFLSCSLVTRRTCRNVPFTHCRSCVQADLNVVLTLGSS